METCFKGLADAVTGKITSVIQQISCNPPVTTQYFDWGSWITWTVIAVVLLILWALVGYPRWNVWAQQKTGEADLQQAHKEQQIQVSRAQGRVDAAVLNKEAAIIEAEAVSAQIDKIGQQLTKHDLYLKWQWIKMMEDHADQATIYIPTEAGMPILEAGKRSSGFPKVEEA